MSPLFLRTFLIPFILMFLVKGLSAADIIVRQEPLTQKDTLATKPLYAYLRFPEMIFTPSLKTGQAALPMDVFYKAAEALPDITEKLTISGKKILDVSPVMLMKLLRGYSKSSAVSDIKKQRLKHIRDLEKRPLAIMKSPINIKIDAKFIADIAASEMFPYKIIKTYKAKYFGEQKQMVVIDRAASWDFYHAYRKLKNIPNFKAQMKHIEFASVRKDLSKYPYLDRNSKLSIANISYGRPIIYTAEEKGLRLPYSLSRDSDVYWVEFAISLHTPTANSFDEIVFNVRMLKAAIALDLLPWEYGVRKKIKEKTALPSVKFKLSGLMIEIGEFYRRSVAFEMLKPVIIATGLQENRFSWILRDEAVDVGSKRFVAIISVPKTVIKLPIVMNVSATTKSLLFQGRTAFGESVLHDLQLK